MGSDRSPQSRTNKQTNQTKGRCEAAGTALASAGGAVKISLIQVEVSQRPTKTQHRDTSDAHRGVNRKGFSVRG